MKYSFCSYSFHRLLAAGKQDIFQHIRDVKVLGACQIDPWNAHLAAFAEGDKILHAGGNPDDARLQPADQDYLRRVKDAALEAGLPWGCVAIDGGHIYEEDEGKRKANRAVARRWLDIAGFLGASHARIDAGGPENMPDHAFKVIEAGYKELIAYAADRGVRVLTENHWGPSRVPANCVRLIESIPGLGLLFDSNNWVPELQREGWERCARLAEVTHIKTFAFDARGWDSTVDLRECIRLLVAAGYKGIWGIESCPRNGDEYEGARKSIRLIELALGENVG
jgi:sugar phosphate isomerase/epimerase